MDAEVYDLWIFHVSTNYRQFEAPLDRRLFYIVHRTGLSTEARLETESYSVHLFYDGAALYKTVTFTFNQGPMVLLGHMFRQINTWLLD